MINRSRVQRDKIAIAIRAAERWQRREPVRSGAQERYRHAGPMAADTPDRATKFLVREGLRRALGPYPRVSERMIGPTLDFSSYAPDENARKAGAPVARIIQMPQPGVIPDGFGSGFLVAPQLLLTNHHVFPTLPEAKNTGANFYHEYTSAGLQLGPIFEIDPDTFYVASEALDFALVAVKPTAADGTQLDSLGYVRLIQATGKILVGHPVNIIQHPAGGPKQYATTQNKLLDVLDEGFLTYTTDTLEGSSGSPAFNQYWEVVGLHHSGVPLVQNGNVIAKNGQPWEEEMGDDQVMWIANEAVRVSYIVQYLSTVKIADAKQQAMLQTLLGSTADPLAPEGALVPAVVSVPPAIKPQLPIESETAMAQTIINITGNPTIYVNAPAPAAITTPPVTTTTTALIPPALEKKQRFDTKYSKRPGFKSDFLPGFRLPLLDVTAARKDELLKDDNGDPRVLKYHHFSLVMNKQRRLQMWSAVNVDYSADKKPPEGTDRKTFGGEDWTLDPRIDAEDQIQDDEFYKPATNVDRGHMVRREDNCWGDTPLEIEYANADTYHWTNCSPQHERFNQERQTGIWGKFEAHITRNIHAVGNRASIYAGPILDNANDPEYNFIQYPVRFWKVVAAVSRDNGFDELVVCGFVFDQTDVMEKFGLERIDFVKFKTFQRSLASISAATGVVFPQILLENDVLRNAPNVDERRPLDSLDQVRIRRDATDLVAERERKLREVVAPAPTTGRKSSR